MKKYFLLIFLLSSYLLSSEIVIKDSVFIDEKSTLTFKEIIKKKDNFFPIERYNMGILKSSVWIRLQVTNRTDKELVKRLYNKRYRLDFIDVYILKNNKLTSSYKLGASQKHNIRDNHFRASYFDVTLLAKESVEIFIKQKSFSSMEVQWHLTSIDDFNDYFSTLNTIYFGVLGMLVVTAIASFMLYFLLKNRYYLIYSFFTICSIIYQFSLAGYFYQLGLPLYFNMVSLYAVSESAVILLGLFPLSFFELKQGEYKILTTLIKTIIVFKVFIIIGYLLYPLNDNFLYNVKYGSAASMLLMLILLALSIKTFIDKKIGAGFYLLANIFLASAAIYFVLGLQGLMPTTTLLYYSLSIGVIGQDFFLAIALVYATYKIKDENEKNKEMINDYSKLTYMGETMVNIYHQWKSPVNNIYNYITHIETAKEFEDKDIDKIIDTNLNKIKQNTQYLRETASEFLKMNNLKKSTEEKVNLSQEIESVLKLMDTEFKKNKIKITTNYNRNIFLNTHKNQLRNLLMILVENSIKTFRNRGTKNPELRVSTTMNEESITLIVEDNAGGIIEKPINKIFERYHSASDSSGIGLYLAKHVLMEKLKGTIEAKNSENGAIFEIILYLNK